MINICIYNIYIYTSSKPLGYRTLFPQRLFQPRSIHNSPCLHREIGIITEQMPDAAGTSRRWHDKSKSVELMESSTWSGVDHLRA